MIKMSKVLSFVVVLLAVLAASFMVHNDTYAAASLTITVNNGASLSITPTASGTLVTTDTTGNTAASFSASTDNMTGYKLQLSSTNNTLSTTITKDNVDTTYSFTSISSAINATAFNTNTYNNKWGIKPSKYNSNNNTNYLPVPTTAIVLDETSAGGSNNYTLGFGLRANYENPAATYTGTLVLTLIANPVPAMQDATNRDLATQMPNNGDTMIFRDARDDENYTIANINGTYWMTDNLRITGTVTAALSNFTGSDFNISAGSLTSGDSYTEARSFYDSAYPEMGAYYNYCAASAGTVCTQTVNFDETTADICPAGWRLPNESEMNVIINTSGSNWNAVAAGVYKNGRITESGLQGRWFITSIEYGERVVSLGYNFLGNPVWTIARGSFAWGRSIRCVKIPDPLLYDTVADMSKGNFDMSTINDTLTAGNSGVYKYTGSHNDGASTKDIYFYRGIIDNTFTGTNGSSGNGDGGYPNYVKLATTVGDVTTNTCWRVFRTTGSGGVKMLYNGTWTGSTCARDGSTTAAAGAYYNRVVDRPEATCNSSTQYCGTQGYIVYAGYNYSSTYITDNYTSAVNDSVLFTNDTPSNIRTVTENWYASKIGSANNGLFESDAGYCNDRSKSGTTTVPYQISNASVTFAPYNRIMSNAQPTLACPNTNGHDLLNGTNGKSYPVALITADELALAGSGYSGKEAYAGTSFLNSGTYFWTLSPIQRYADGAVATFVMYPDGDLHRNYSHLRYGNGVRPVVSLAPGTRITGGSGTAADPWIVQ